MSEQAGRVLLVEDDPNVAELLTLHLGDAGLAVQAESSGPRGLQQALEKEYILIILDVMLPGLDGLEICKRVRAKKKNTPILMLTAKSEELDKVLGLELGADDYLTKPFSIRELLARVKALIRRTQVFDDEAPGRGGEPLKRGNLSIDLDKRIVTVSDRPVELTAKEYDLLVLFASNPGRAFSRQQLLDQVWGYQFEGYQHTVNSHINRLRNKIEDDPSNPIYLKTVWGFGYRFAEPPER